MVLVHLCGPEASINAEIVSAANDREQAGQVFKYVRQIVELSPKLTDALDVVASKKRVVYHGRGNVYAALSAEAGTKHGMNPAVVIYDELAQSKNTELFDALETAQGAQMEPLFFVISTQSHDPQHPLSQLIDDGLSGEDDAIVCHLYEVPEDADIWDEDVWYGANPALGDFRSLDELRRYAAKCRRLPSKENTLRNLYLNQRVSLDAVLFSRSLWLERTGIAAFEPGEEIYLALDLATTTDLCALAMVSKVSGALRCFFWKPEEMMDEHGKRDRRNYRQWLKEGYMERCPGKSISRDLVAQKVAELHTEYRVLGLAYDRWRIDEMMSALERQHLTVAKDDSGDICMVPWGQGWHDMAPAVDAIETAAIESDLIHDGNPVLTWNMANAIVKMDPAGNRKLDKSKSRMRIDGAVATTMAFGLRARFRGESNDSIYQTQKLATA